MAGKRTKLMAAALLSLALVAAWGCGSTPPTDELLSARQAYADAEASEAEDVVPDLLLAAKQALEAAEREHGERPGSLEERTLAYVAERQARLAVASAYIKQARAQLQEALDLYRRELERAQKKTRGRLHTTRDSLGKTRGELEKVQGELARQESELTEKREALLQREKELKAKEAELERERKAREEAEARAAAAMASLEEIAKVKEEARGVVITLSGSVLFKTGQSDLLPIAQQQLAHVAAALLEQDQEKEILVEGHTDSRGSRRANRTLSQARAESVRAFLIEQGIAGDRIVALGKGQAEPVADNRTAEGRANNRRVEIIVKNR